MNGLEKYYWRQGYKKAFLEKYPNATDEEAEQAALEAWCKEQVETAPKIDPSKIGIVVYTTSEFLEAVQKGYKEITWIDRDAARQVQINGLEKALAEYRVKRDEFAKSVFTKIASSSKDETQREEQ